MFSLNEIHTTKYVANSHIDSSTPLLVEAFSTINCSTVASKLFHLPVRSMNAIKSISIVVSQLLQ